MHLCPVCGYELGFEPWHGASPSDEICPSCGIQFGYDDSRPESRAFVYAAWRKRWVDGGMCWWSQLPEPDSWDPSEQLARLQRLTT